MGSDADIVVLGPAGTTTLSGSTSPSEVDYSIYEGWPVQGAIRHVLSTGNEIASGSRVNTDRRNGRFVRRGPTVRPG